MARNEFYISRKTPPILGAASLLLFAAIGFAVVWASVTHLPEIIRAQGQIAPLGRLQNVGHFDGGVVQSVFVRAGDRVQEGDVIAVVRQPDIDADIVRVQEQINVKEQDIERLKPVLTFLTNHGEAASSTQTTSFEDLEWSFARQYRSEQIKLYLSKRETLLARVARARASLSAAGRVTEKLQGRVAFAQSRMNRTRASFDLGITSAAGLEDAADGLEQMQSELLQANIRVLEAEDRHSDALTAIEEERIIIQQEFYSELYQTQVELRQLKTELDLYNQSIDRAQVVATTSGSVQNLNFTSPGEVVAAGDTVATLLPADDQLVAKVRVAPLDIGHISADTPVRLSVTTFDVRRYGYIEGTILAISPTSVSEDQGDAYYDVTVALENTTLGEGSLAKEVRAGMEISAEFVSSSKSLLSYFVGPIQTALLAAFTER